MTLNDVTELLNISGIPFYLRKYQSEMEYLRKTNMPPYTRNVRLCKTVVLVIESVNGHKNIEIQFNLTDGVFLFEQLRFGHYSFELFDCDELSLSDCIIDNIRTIMSGNLKIIVCNDMKKGHRIEDMCFDISEDASEEDRFYKALNKISRPKGLFQRIIRSEKQYEVFDWNSYQNIVK